MWFYFHLSSLDDLTIQTKWSTVCWSTLEWSDTFRSFSHLVGTPEEQFWACLGVGAHNHKVVFALKNSFQTVDQLRNSIHHICVRVCKMVDTRFFSLLLLLNYFSVVPTLKWWRWTALLRLLAGHQARIPCWFLVMRAVLKRHHFQEDQGSVLWTTAELKNSLHTSPTSGWNKNPKLQHEINLSPDRKDMSVIWRVDWKRLYVHVLLAWRTYLQNTNWIAKRWMLWMSHQFTWFASYNFISILLTPGVH